MQGIFYGRIQIEDECRLSVDKCNIVTIHEAYYKDLSEMVISKNLNVR